MTVLRRANLSARIRRKAAQLFTVSELQPEELAPFCKALFANLQFEPAAETQEQSRRVALGIRLLDTPVGVIAGDAENQGRGRLRFVYIARKYRRRGLGSHLLKEWEKAMVRNGCNRFEVLYRCGPETKEWEPWLQRQGWNEPFPHSTIYTALLSKCIDWAWLAAGKAVPPPFSVVPWNAVADEKKALLHSDVKDWIPSFYSPHVYANNLDARFSTVLQDQDEVVGWLLVNHVSEQSAVISCMYVRPPYQGAGRARHLISAVVSRLAEAGIEQVKFQVRGDNDRMMAFVRKRLSTAMREVWEYRFMNKKHSLKNFNNQTIN